jgi:hypothetical protein
MFKARQKDAGNAEGPAGKSKKVDDAFRRHLLSDFLGRHMSLRPYFRTLSKVI